MAKVNPNDPTRVSPRVDSPAPLGIPSTGVPSTGAIPNKAPDIGNYRDITRAGARPVGGKWTAGADPVVNVAGVSRPVSKHLEASLDEMGPNLSLAELDGLRARNA